MTVPPFFDAFGDIGDDGDDDGLHEEDGGLFGSPSEPHGGDRWSDHHSDDSGLSTTDDIHSLAWTELNDGQDVEIVDVGIDASDGDVIHSTQRAITTTEGNQAAYLLEHPELDQGGTLSVVSAKHGIVRKGDQVWVQLIEGDDDPFGAGTIPATITHIAEGSDRFRAEIDSEYADLIHDFDADIVRGEEVKVGDSIEFEQMAGAGVQEDVMRLGYVSGESGFGAGTHTLRQTDSGPGSSGSMVISQETGHVAGMVMAYDEAQHLNVIDDIERVMQDLDDFASADPSRLEDRASEVDYGDATPVTCYAQQQDEARARNRFGPAGGPRCEGD